MKCFSRVWFQTPQMDRDGEDMSRANERIWLYMPTFSISRAPRGHGAKSQRPKAVERAKAKAEKARKRKPKVT